MLTSAFNPLRPVATHICIMEINISPCTNKSLQLCHFSPYKAEITAILFIIVCSVFPDHPMEVIQRVNEIWYYGNLHDVT